MKRWINAASVVGVFCTSVCFLGLPLLLFWVPAVGLGWLHNEWIVRSMLLMFLAMFGAGAAGAFREHRDPRPGITAAVSAAVLIGTAWHRAPVAAGWLAMAGIVAAWSWDWRLLKRQHVHGGGSHALHR